MSLKGISVTVARCLVDALSGAGIVTYIAHDFDKSGMTIAAHHRDGFAAVHVQGTHRWWSTSGSAWTTSGRIGLEDLEDSVTYGTKKDPRVNLAESGATPEEQAFLVSGGRRPEDWRGRRVELNAMMSHELIAWLEGKLREHGVEKVVPDAETLGAAYRRAVLPRGRTSPPSPTAISSIRTRATTPPARP